MWEVKTIELQYWSTLEHSVKWQSTTDHENEFSFLVWISSWIKNIFCLTAHYKAGLVSRSFNRRINIWDGGLVGWFIQLACLHTVTEYVGGMDLELNGSVSFILPSKLHNSKKDMQEVLLWLIFVFFSPVVCLSLSDVNMIDTVKVNTYQCRNLLHLLMLWNRVFLELCCFCCYATVLPSKAASGSEHFGNCR